MVDMGVTQICGKSSQVSCYVGGGVTRRAGFWVWSDANLLGYQNLWWGGAVSVDWLLSCTNMVGMGWYDFIVVSAEEIFRRCGRWVGACWYNSWSGCVWVDTFWLQCRWRTFLEDVGFGVAAVLVRLFGLHKVVDRRLLWKTTDQSCLILKVTRLICSKAIVQKRVWLTNREIKRNGISPQSRVIPTHKIYYTQILIDISKIVIRSGEGKQTQNFYSDRQHVL